MKEDFNLKDIKTNTKINITSYWIKISINILLDVLVYNITVYFYEFCSTLGESKYKERVKIYSDIVDQNIQ